MQSYRTKTFDSKSAMILRARCVAPMDGPIIDDGAVAVHGGHIVGVGKSELVRSEFPDDTVTDYGDAVILPGLVNAHVHLELSDLTPPPGQWRLADWLAEVVKQFAPPGEAGAERIRCAVKAGAAECLRSGITCVGDISQRCALSREILRDSPLHVVSYGEVLAMATRRGLLAGRLALAADEAAQNDTLRIGISPHAPYSVETEGYRKCLERARQGQLPIATHLAESIEEAEFLVNQTGPLRELWGHIGGWDDAVPRFPGGPIRMMEQLGYLHYSKTLLAHVNHCNDDELRILAHGKASVVYCPRTHAYFGHPPHRWREMLAMGINVAVGTDSRGSSPDLNLVEDLRLLHRLAPELSPEQIWEMGTARGAAAVGCADSCGKLTTGRRADLVVFRASGNDPLREILENQAEPCARRVGGQSHDVSE
jgi:cytosine/adenosine deaminase-related metal-dependent hydrolase